MRAARVTRGAANTDDPRVEPVDSGDRASELGASRPQQPCHAEDLALPEVYVGILDARADGDATGAEVRLGGLVAGVDPGSRTQRRRASSEHCLDQIDAQHLSRQVLAYQLA